MKKFLPYFLIAILFLGYLLLKHQDILRYKFNLNLIPEYLRSQDIEDPQSKIKDRIFISDSDIYIATGYLYAKGTDPTEYNFQHPPLMKYLFGFSTLLTGNPFYIQIIFGFFLLFLTYFLGKKLLGNTKLSIFAALLLLIDPVFSGMMSEALLDLGQAVFALSYVILTFFYPDSFVLQGILLGFFAASKFWSTVLIFIFLIFGYKILIKKENVNYRKTLASFFIAIIVFSLTYTVSFIKAGGLFNIFLFEGRVLKFMITHNSAGSWGASIFLFLTGYFTPWWQSGVARSDVWNFFWPLSLLASSILLIKTKIRDINFFFFSLPVIYLILISTEVPFTRYFIIILPFLYLNLSSLFFSFLKRYNWKYQ